MTDDVILLVGPPELGQLRKCTVRKWATFQGYGFNLHADSTGAQFLGAVDAGSPAEAAGMREADRIIEVNGQSTAAKSHAEVVQIIKSDPAEATLLLATPAVLEEYRAAGVTPHGGLAQVSVIVCPEAPPAEPAQHETQATGERGARAGRYTGA